MQKVRKALVKDKVDKSQYQVYVDSDDEIRVYTYVGKPSDEVRDEPDEF